MSPTLTPPRDHRTTRRSHQTAKWQPARDFRSPREVYRGALAGFNGLRIMKRRRSADAWNTEWDCLLSNGVVLYNVAPEHIVTKERTALICDCCLQWAADQDDHGCRFFLNHGEADHPAGLGGNIDRAATPVYVAGNLVAMPAQEAPSNRCDGCSGHITDGRTLCEVFTG